MIGRIYIEDHYTLLHTKYESFAPCGFGEEDFFMFFLMTPRGGAHMDPRGTVGRIYKEDHYTLLHTKYESSGPCGFGEDFLKVFPPTPPGRGPYGPQGHSWQDLQRGTLYIATNKI